MKDVSKMVGFVSDVQMSQNLSPLNSSCQNFDAPGGFTGFTPKPFVGEGRVWVKFPICATSDRSGGLGSCPAQFSSIFENGV